MGFVQPPDDVGPCPEKPAAGVELRLGNQESQALTKVSTDVRLAYKQHSLPLGKRAISCAYRLHGYFIEVKPGRSRPATIV